MAAHKILRAVSLPVNRRGLKAIGNVQAQNVRLPAIPLKFIARSAHCKTVTKNINYVSNNKLPLITDSKTLKLNQTDKPLCIILSWIVAKPRHLMKYADIYLELGYDVVLVSCSPLQLMLPTRGSQIIAADLLRFLESNDDHNPMVVHGFSVGAYVWSELLVHALADLERYQSVLDRVQAQVWDSPADVDELPIGLPFALFPNDLLLQKALGAYIRSHMRVFHNVATKHYLKATHAYHNTPCHAPSLFLVSKTDPVGAEKRSRRAHDMMTAAGMKCNWKCWDESPHVQHFNRHPEEYLEHLYSHLRDCGLLQPLKMQMKTMQ